jgi:hypothetical protein
LARNGHGVGLQPCPLIGEFFQHEFPHERSDLSHWRKRLGDKLELLLAENLRVSTSWKAEQARRAARHLKSFGELWKPRASSSSMKTAAVRVCDFVSRGKPGSRSESCSENGADCRVLGATRPPRLRENRQSTLEV